MNPQWYVSTRDTDKILHKFYSNCLVFKGDSYNHLRIYKGRFIWSLCTQAGAFVIVYTQTIFWDTFWQAYFAWRKIIPADENISSNSTVSKALQPLWIPLSLTKLLLRPLFLHLNKHITLTDSNKVSLFRCFEEYYWCLFTVFQ